MKSLGVAVMLLGAVVGGPALADDDDDKPVPQETRTKIEQVLASMDCKLGTIEFDDDGYEVDNANCADGRMEIELDRDLKVTSREKEDDDDRPR